MAHRNLLLLSIWLLVTPQLFSTKISSHHADAVYPVSHTLKSGIGKWKVPATFAGSLDTKDVDIGLLSQPTLCVDYPQGEERFAVAKKAVYMNIKVLLSQDQLIYLSDGRVFILDSFVLSDGTALNVAVETKNVAVEFEGTKDASCTVLCLDPFPTKEHKLVRHHFSAGGAKDKCFYQLLDCSKKDFRVYLQLFMDE